MEFGQSIACEDNQKQTKMTKSHIFWCPKPGVPGSKHIASYSEQDCDNTCRQLSCWLHYRQIFAAQSRHTSGFSMQNHAKPIASNPQIIALCWLYFSRLEALFPLIQQGHASHRESCSAQMISLLAISFSCWMTSTASPGSYRSPNK